MMSMLKRIVLSIFMLTSVSISILAQQQDTLVVSRDGTGKYRTIQEAVEAVRAFMDYTVTIYIKNGLYKEKYKWKTAWPTAGLDLGCGLKTFCALHPT